MALSFEEILLGGLLFDDSIRASLPAAFLSLELLTKLINQANIQLLGDGSVVSGEGFSSRVLYTQPFGNLHQERLTSLRLPFSWMTFRKKISLVFNEILEYLFLFLRVFLNTGLPETISLAIKLTKYYRLKSNFNLLISTHQLTLTLTLQLQPVSLTSSYF